MADFGFDIEDDLVPYGVNLVLHFYMERYSYKRSSS